MIPRTAHFIWLQGRASLPQWLSELHDTFTYFNPSWRVRWWDESQILDMGLKNEQAYLDAGKIVPPDSVFQMKSDIARYEILNRYGGVYADADYKWQKPIDSLLTGANFVMCWEVQNTWLANGFIGSVPGHPTLRRFIEDIPDSVSQSRGKRIRANRITGPKFVTGRTHPGDRLLDSWTLNPVPWNQPERCVSEEFPHSTAIHMWQHQRQLRGEVE